MSRQEWTIGGLLAVALAIGVALFMLWWRPGSPGSEPGNGGAWVGQTALASYQLATSLAQTWAGDAALASASGAATKGPESLTGETDWTFTFYSPSRSATALISVAQQGATLLSTQQVTQPVMTVGGEGWKIDSPALVAQMLASGGQAFLDQQPGATLILNLSAGNGLTWEGVLFAAESGQAFSLRMNGTDGQLSR